MRNKKIIELEEKKHNGSISKKIIRQIQNEKYKKKSRHFRCRNRQFAEVLLSN